MQGHKPTKYRAWGLEEASHSGRFLNVRSSAFWKGYKNEWRLVKRGAKTHISELFFRVVNNTHQNDCFRVSLE